MPSPHSNILRLPLMTSKTYQHLLWSPIHYTLTINDIRYLLTFQDTVIPYTLYTSLTIDDIQDLLTFTVIPYTLFLTIDDIRDLVTFTVIPLYTVHFLLMTSEICQHLPWPPIHFTYHWWHSRLVNIYCDPLYTINLPLMTSETRLVNIYCDHPIHLPLMISETW